MQATRPFHSAARVRILCFSLIIEFTIFHTHLNLFLYFFFIPISFSFSKIFSISGGYYRIRNFARIKFRESVKIRFEPYKFFVF